MYLETKNMFLQEHTQQEAVHHPHSWQRSTVSRAVTATGRDNFCLLYVSHHAGSITCQSSRLLESIHQYLEGANSITLSAQMLYQKQPSHCSPRCQAPNTQLFCVRMQSPLPSPSCCPCFWRGVEGCQPSPTPVGTHRASLSPLG